MGKIKNVIFRNENRGLVNTYMSAKEALKKAKQAEADAKRALVDVMKQFASAYDGNGEQTDYAWASIQAQGKARYIVYKQTNVSGSIDYEKALRDLIPDITDAELEKYRRPATTRTSIEWATAKQVTEIEHN